MKTLLVTGGCGFIGSNFVRLLCGDKAWRIVNLDKLTYAGNLANLAGLTAARHQFVHGDICDRELVERILRKENPWAVVNFAAESHVDRSILDSSPFVTTNIAGVQSLLEAVRKHPVERFLHVSTDEVYGDKEGQEPSAETAALSPSSPYAATKAAADLMCLSYRRTYGTPVIITRSSNNFGPYQFPEKLVPLLIRNALAEMELPVYGDGKQVRDWLFVDDNCQAILSVLQRGSIGSIYNIGTGEGRTNLDIAESICAAIADKGKMDLRQIKKRIRHVADRPGHDRRYAIDASKVRTETGWMPAVDFSTGLKRTVDWYLGHSDWVSQVTSGEYRNYYDRVYVQAWGKDQSVQES
jgi:dTDP-glucose 4,6-dehydratase